MPTENAFLFTETALQRLPARDRRYVVYDSKLPAFGVRVGVSGTKTFHLFFRVNGGKRLRMATLGRYGVVTLDQARREAKRMLGIVAEGKDPLAERDAARAARPIRTEITRWLDEHIASECKPATRRNYKLAAEQHINPTLGSIPVAEIGIIDVERLHGRLKATPYLANRVLAALSSFMTWCEREGMRPLRSNPCVGVERYDERPRKRYLSAAEYARLGKALRDAEKNRTIARAPLTAIRLLLLTGCRPVEIFSLQWQHVDLQHSLLRLPDSKTGPKNVHLPPEAVRVLKRWPKVTDSPYVFPGAGRKHKGKHLINLAKPWCSLREAAKLDDVRLYDACRHSFASMAISKHGQSLPVVGELLGQKQAATTKRYAHLHDDTAKAAATTIGGSIAAALAGGK